MRVARAARPGATARLCQGHPPHNEAGLCRGDGLAPATAAGAPNDDTARTTLANARLPREAGPLGDRPSVPRRTSKRVLARARGERLIGAHPPSASSSGFGSSPTVRACYRVSSSRLSGSGRIGQASCCRTRPECAESPARTLGLMLPFEAEAWALATHVDSGRRIARKRCSAGCAENCVSGTLRGDGCSQASFAADRIRFPE